MTHFSANGEFMAIHKGTVKYTVLLIDIDLKKYEIIGLKSEILKDEELAKKVVDKTYWYFPVKHEVFMNYLEPLENPMNGEWSQRWNVSFGDATQSFQSLCTKYNMDDNEWLILKKKI